MPVRVAVMCLCALAAGACGAGPEPEMTPLDDPGPGISRALAEARAATIDDLRYEVAFTVPADRAAPVEGRVTVRFALDEPQPVVLDFAGGAGDVHALTVNGRETVFTVADGHLVVLGDEGTLVLVEATAEEYREKSRFSLFDGKSWTVPTLSGGKLYVRDEAQLVALDVSR